MMAIEQSPAAATAVATATLIGLTPPISYQDFGWMVLAALIGVLYKHGSTAAEERRKAILQHRVDHTAVNRAELPGIDWTCFAYDAGSAPMLAILGWVGAAVFVKAIWGVDLDPRALFLAAACSGYLGAEWVRYSWDVLRRVVNKRTGG